LQHDYSARLKCAGREGRRPEDVEEVDRQEADAKHDNDCNQHLGDITSCLHLTPSVIYSNPRHVPVGPVT